MKAAARSAADWLRTGPGTTERWRTASGQAIGKPVRRGPDEPHTSPAPPTRGVCLSVLAGRIDGVSGGLGFVEAVIGRQLLGSFLGNAGRHSLLPGPGPPLLDPTIPIARIPAWSGKFDTWCRRRRLSEWPYRPCRLATRQALRPMRVPLRPLTSVTQGALARVAACGLYVVQPNGFSASSRGVSRTLFSRCSARRVGGRAPNRTPTDRVRDGPRSIECVTPDHISRSRSSSSD